MFGIRRQADRLVSPDRNAAGERIERIWDIVEWEGDASLIFDSSPQSF
jgi:hypothetical protein